jgi:endonuclease/exonuclease/phosphatase family metal-dependent hydrolase
MRNKTIKLTAALMFMLLISCASALAAAVNHITTMSWNIHGGNPLGTIYPHGHDGDNCSIIPQLDARFAQTIRDNQVDVVGLQEIHRNQLQELVEALSDNHTRTVTSFFTPTKRCYPLRTNLSDPNPDPDPNHPHAYSLYDYGNAIIVIGLNTYNHVSKPYYLLNDPVLMRRKYPEYTMLDAVSVQAPGGGWARIYNTHLTGDNSLADAASKPQSSLNPNPSPLIGPGQVLSAALTIYYTDGQVNRKYPLILMGDFNFHPPSSPYRFPYMAQAYVLLKKLGFRDIVAELYGEWTPTGYTVSAPAPYKRIDYIELFNEDPKKNVPRINADWANVPYTGFISDHFPTVAQLSF